MINKAELALFTDLYELTMLQAYWRLGMQETATFSLFVRKLPESRNFLLACGIDETLDLLAQVRFETDQLEYLRSLKLFQPDFLHWLRTFRFTGDVFAVAEGTPLFAQEPILEIVAPIPQAQLVETLVMNQVHLQTLIASKAVRVVAAAEGRRIVDFGLRRAQGLDAGMKLARASYLAGAHATSNVLAGLRYGIPVAGTMAHSFVQAFDRESEAFRAFAELYPQTTLLVDTYDTLAGVRQVITMAREMGPRFNVQALRLDSGDLAALARAARQLLDEAGLQSVQLFASGGLDEYSIRDLLRAGADVDGFGVGTHMAVSEDAPALDIAYKLTSYAGRDRRKRSTGKESLPGQKQIYRQLRDGCLVQDTLARVEENYPGQALLQPVMKNGERLAASTPLQQLREQTRERIAQLPADLLQLEKTAAPYPVELSAALRSVR